MARNFGAKSEKNRKQAVQLILPSSDEDMANDNSSEGKVKKNICIALLVGVLTIVLLLCLAIYAISHSHIQAGIYKELINKLMKDQKEHFDQRLDKTMDKSSQQLQESHRKLNISIQKVQESHRMLNASMQNVHHNLNMSTQELRESHEMLNMIMEIPVKDIWRKMMIVRGPSEISIDMVDLKVDEYKEKTIVKLCSSDKKLYCMIGIPFEQEIELWYQLHEQKSRMAVVETGVWRTRVLTKKQLNISVCFPTNKTQAILLDKDQYWLMHENNSYVYRPGTELIPSFSEIQAKYYICAKKIDAFNIILIDYDKVWKFNYVTQNKEVQLRHSE